MRAPVSKEKGAKEQEPEGQRKPGGEDMELTSGSGVLDRVGERMAQGVQEPVTLGVGRIDHEDALGFGADTLNADGRKMGAC